MIAHGWRLLWGCLPMKSNLCRRNVLKPIDNLNCTLCLSSDETERHIFFEYPIAHEVWMKCYSWFQIQTALHSGTSKILLILVTFWEGRRVKNMLWWNAKILANEEFSIDKLMEELKARLWSWFSARNWIKYNIHFNDWLEKPKSCVLL